MAVTVTELSPDAGTDLVDAWVRIRRETDIEINPDDPPWSGEELLSDVFVPREHTRYRAWVAHLDGEPAGEAILAVETDADNRHVAGIETLAVCPGLRGRGVGAALADAAFAAAEREGRTSVLAWVPVGPPTPAADWCRRLGMTLASSERCSRVRVADLDRDLLQGWIDDASGPALGYRLVHYQDHCPAEYRDALVAANAAMQDMPTDDLDWTVPRYTADDLARRDEQYALRRWSVAGTLAIAPDGSAAGFSEIVISRFRPQIGYQGDTGVVPAHRGHGLGRWLKAANLAWAEKVLGAFDVIETYNAESNPWMLGINVAMGFRPHIGYDGYQGDVATVLAALA